MAAWFLRIWMLVLCCYPFAAQSAGNINIFGDENYPPVIFRNNAGQPSGLLVEVLRQYQSRSGQSIQLQLLPWKRAYKSAESGLGGVIGLSKTSARLPLFDYSDPIYDDDIHIVVLKGHEFTYQSIADLKGRLIGTQLGASFGNEVDVAIADGRIQVDRDPVHAHRLRKLLRGRIDAAFIGNGKLGIEQLLAADPELSANRDKFVILPTPLTRDALYLGFAKSQHMGAFIADFNKVLQQLKKDHAIAGLAASGKD